MVGVFYCAAIATGATEAATGAAAPSLICFATKYTPHDCYTLAEQIYLANRSSDSGNKLVKN
jgi:hypothetical protein